MTDARTRSPLCCLPAAFARVRLVRCERAQTAKAAGQLLLHALPRAVDPLGRKVAYRG